MKDYSFSQLRIADEELQYAGEKVQFADKCKVIFDLIKGSTRILDVGCGSGRLLELAGAHFPQARRVGIELNKKRAEVARKKAHCDVLGVPVEEMAITESFDAVVMNNVLSHISSLDQLFRQLKKILSPEGRLVIVAGEHSHRIQKTDIFDWSIPDHLHFLGLQTMDYICANYDFNILSRKRVPYSQELFSRTFFLTPGRSPARNRIKFAIAQVPFALQGLAKLYDILKGERIYTSTIVLGHSCVS